jgi:hypothetical protein
MGLCVYRDWRFYETKNGAGDGTRTRDIYLGKVVLYQLSYSRAKRYQPSNR